MCFVLVITALLITAPGYGGAREDRTPDLLRARQALSQLSYGPKLDLFSLCSVAFVPQSVMYLLYTPFFVPPAPCLRKKSLRLLVQTR